MCNVQEDIVIEDAGDGNGIFVTVVIVISTLDNLISELMTRFETINNGIGSEPKNGITFLPGHFIGKHRYTLS